MLQHKFYSIKHTLLRIFHRISTLLLEQKISNQNLVHSKSLSVSASTKKTLWLQLNILLVKMNREKLSFYLLLLNYLMRGRHAGGLNAGDNLCLTI